MMAVLETIGIKAATILAGKIATEVLKGVGDRLNPTELERALEVAILAADQQVYLFYPAEQGLIPDFLHKVFTEKAIEELQKTLKQDGSPPDGDFLVKAFEQALEDNPKIKSRGIVKPEQIQAWMEVFAQTYFEQTRSYLKFQVAKRDYLEQLTKHFTKINFAGVAVESQEIEEAERLAQIFVMPDVQEDGGDRRSGLLTESGFDLLAEDGSRVLREDDFNSRQAELFREQRSRAQLERSGRKFSARQLLTQNQKQVVLLGAPGSGKTTLMSYFAVTAAKGLSVDTEGLRSNTKGLQADTKPLQADTKALQSNTKAMYPDAEAMQVDTKGLQVDTAALQVDTAALPLPILIRIRDWARHSEMSLPKFARFFAEQTLHVKPLPPDFFEYWLDNGRALILLDGLDEVAEESKRYHIVQCIENFLGQYPGNRAIITSRPAGYKGDFFRTEEFPHYELQLFDDAKMEEFVNRWYDSRVQDTAEAQRRKESLRKALNDNDRIKHLARNPLLLTIIALIHRYQAVLPKERYKLYDKAVETLLTSWDANKELTNQTVLHHLKLDDLRRLMESLAYWIHSHPEGNTGDAAGGTLIDRDELIQKLSQEIKTLKQLQLYEAKEEAKRFVEFIRDRTGLLNEQGQDCYAFVHKTFQEYLCAQEINYQAENEGDFEIVLKHITNHLHQQHWREVLLLLIAQQKPKPAAKAIRAIYEHQSEYEQWLHRDLLFAGSCLAENPKNLKTADNGLSEEILTRLVELEANGSSTSGRKVQSYVFLTLCRLFETDFESRVLSLLKSLEERIGKVRLQEYRVELGEYQEAIETLVSLLKNEDLKVSQDAAWKLRGLDTDKSQVKDICEKQIQKLIVLLDDEGFLTLSTERELRLYRTTAEILGKFGRDSEMVLNLLLQMLKSENSHMRSAAATGLGWYENKSEEILQLIIDFANSNLKCTIT
ncbi:NACHT domain-containing protein [Kovacikia minuta CCNUW1]|uniref:NACHT domain-containing protein n=1 Tax=Kovacikia minuta TaxID=2931930 RepID=UPI001CCBB6E1|nr:NACHT domain-containing protein [Kovacikia minuta]UBF26959.1 NACHT domain-containing protein [Kovacikia minuta CCNUW1]